MSKKEDLELIDELYRKFVIEALRSGSIDFKDASQVVQYLKANEATSTRVIDDEENHVKERLKKIRAKREKE